MSVKYVFKFYSKRVGAKFFTKIVATGTKLKDIFHGVKCAALRAWDFLSTSGLESFLCARNTENMGTVQFHRNSNFIVVLITNMALYLNTTFCSIRVEIQGTGR
jgi:hypothetical protein